MMKQMSYGFGLLLFLFSALQLSAISKGDVLLYGDVGQSKVRLMWVAEGWPTDVMGFNVKRREVTKDWTTLNGKPIYPQITQNRKWSNMGLNSEQESFYSSKLAQMLDSGKLTQEVPKEMFYKAMQTRGMSSGDRIRFRDDHGNAVIMGFAYFDNTFDHSKQFEYGLFGVSASGVEGKKPLSVFKAVVYSEEDERLKVDLKATAYNGRVQLAWEVSNTLAEEINLLGYNMYRKLKKSDKWEKIAKSTYCGDIHNDQIRSWTDTDPESSSTQNYYYAVAPINMFRTEFTKSIVKYEGKEIR